MHDSTRHVSATVVFTTLIHIVIIVIWHFFQTSLSSCFIYLFVLIQRNDDNFLIFDDKVTSIRKYVQIFKWWYFIFMRCALQENTFLFNVDDVGGAWPCTVKGEQVIGWQRRPNWNNEFHRSMHPIFCREINMQFSKYNGNV